MTAPDDGGSVTAELAVALPAVVLVLALALGGLSAAASRVRLEDAAADAARLLSRGEDSGRAAAAVARAVTGARLTTGEREGLVCATASATVRIVGVALPLQATSCALASGW